MSIADTRFKLSMFDKLTRQKERSENKVRELNFEMELLKKSGESNNEYMDKLFNSKFNASEKLRNTIAALDQLEKDMNGCSTLNPFLKEKVESETEE